VSPPLPSGATPFQADILALQLELYRHNEDTINAAVDGYTPQFERYAARYRRTVRKVDGPARLERLIEATHDADVTLVGDYHTLSQSQRTFYRLLRRQPEDGADIVVALEMFPASHDENLAKFVAGRIQEKTLLRRVGHVDRWPFGSLLPLRPVFELCRERGWRVIGIDTDSSAPLDERDAFAAERIADALAEGGRAFVLIGEMHLAPAHLPRSLKRTLPKKCRVLRVHQNPERIWFDQAAQGVVDDHEVLRIGPDAFALLTASPVVCQQSFLTWLDRLQDGEIESPRALDADAAEDLFVHAAKMIARALDLGLGEALDHVEIVGPSDLHFFDRLCRSGMFTRQEAKQIKAHILASESYYIPRARLVYLATFSINHAAEEASHFLRHHVSGEGLEDPQGMVDAFYGRILNEAIGFMGSKLVNPKRKCVHVRDLKKLVADSDAPPAPRGHRRRAPRLASTGGHEAGGLSAMDIETAQYVVAHKRMERGTKVPWLAQVFDSDAQLFNAVTHALGYILGDQLYYALVRGVLTKDDARRLYAEPFEEDGAALMLYFELATRLRNVRIPQRT
jgi:hypothetical protein